MNSAVFNTLRRANRYVKQLRRAAAGLVISPVRRIEFVAPPQVRMCAMTFDDGPTIAPCNPANGKQGLTEHILNTLAKHDATATFNIIGSTAEGYPDTKGDPGSQYVFGHKYDHYPYFGADAEAGARNCQDLLLRMVSEGHELSNHGYRHILFGQEYFVYRRRTFFRDFEEVLQDLERLHDLVLRSTGYEMRLARPPHYVDGIGRLKRDSAYTAYAEMGYHYLAASVDGGGWVRSCGNYDADVRKMIRSLQNMLEEDPDSLNGQIIFQKDGYNMSLQSPVADALDAQLELLTDYGYSVVSVSEMMSHSPFEDLYHDHPAFLAVHALEQCGEFTLGFLNNTFKPDAPILSDEFDAMCTHRARPRRVWRRFWQPMSVDGIKTELFEQFGHACEPSGNTRGDAAIALYETLLDVGYEGVLSVGNNA